MKSMPQILKLMTAMPHTIGLEIPLIKAKEIMQEHRIRHLPVLDGGKLVGIISDRDIKLAGNFKDSESMLVGDVMTPDPYKVKPDAELGTVVDAMAEHRYGCAVVEQDNGKVVGIFTAHDGLRALSDLLHESYKAR